MVKNREKTSHDKFDCHKKNRNEQSAHYGMLSEASRFFRCYDDRITLLLWRSFFTHIKDWPAKIYLYGSLNTCKFLEPWFLQFWHVKPGKNGLKCVWEGFDNYKICKPATCNFMKKVNHLQWFKYLANFVKVNILRNSLKRLHMIFVIYFLGCSIKI